MVISLLVGIPLWIGVDVWAGISSRWYTAASLDPTQECDDLSVLVPIYGNVRYLQNANFLRSYGSKVALCTTSSESEEF